MIQPDHRTVPEGDIGQYKLGSLTITGMPTKKRLASVLSEFLSYVQQMLCMAIILFMATMFSHNIGLGAARDPKLIRTIGTSR